MSKAYLALKAVENGHSIFAEAKGFKTEYKVGKRVTCGHPEFPFFLANQEEVWGHKNDVLSVGSGYTDILLVRVLAKDVREKLRWATSINERGADQDAVLRSLLQEEKSWLLATSVLPIEYVPKGADLREYLKQAAKRFHLPILKKV